MDPIWKTFSFQIGLPESLLINSFSVFGNHEDTAWTVPVIEFRLDQAVDLPFNVLSINGTSRNTDDEA
jgi:hypothetical protein